MSVDVLVVACQGREDDRSLQIIDGAHRDRTDRADRRPLDRLAERVPPPRLRGRRRRHGALPAVEGAAPVRDEQGDRPPTRRARTAEPREGRLDLRPRAEGRHRQDAHVDATSPSRSRSAGRRSRSSTSTSSSATSALALGLPPEKTIYDLASLRRLARRRQARRRTSSTHHVRRATSLLAPTPARPGERGRRSSSCATIYAIAAVALRLRHRRHAAGLHAPR